MSTADSSEEGTAGFFSLSTYSANCSDGSTPLYRYRILSSHNFTNRELHQFLKPCPELTLGNEEQKIITWRDTQHWPYAWPTNDFSGSPYRVGISDDVYSTPNIELVSSGIEAAVVMGRNVARLVVQDLKREASLRFARDDLEE